ncbi:MAG TPA: phosphoethanolamine transferase, partial [Nevskiaceae bacterium]
MDDGMTEAVSTHGRRELCTAAIALLIVASYLTLRPFGAYPAQLGAFLDPHLGGRIWLIPLLWVAFAMYCVRHGMAAFATLAWLVFLACVAAESVTFGPLHASTLGTYAALSIVTSGLALALARGGRRLRVGPLGAAVGTLLVWAVLLVPLVYVVYRASFGKPVRATALYAIFQTNNGEATSFVRDFIPHQYLWALLVFAVVVALLVWSFTRGRALQVRKRWVAALAVVAVAMTAVGAHSLELPRFTVGSALRYPRDLAVFQALQKRRAAGRTPVVATKGHSDETYLLIIGESLNRGHMGLYGYLRDTTPRLDKLAAAHEVIVYRNAFSNHTHTMPVLSWALTEANQFNHRHYFDSPSIINLANAAGFTTWWLSNQNMIGDWDNLVSILAHAANHLVSINGNIGKTTQTEDYDGALIPYLEKAVAAPETRDKFIVVHLMGSHSDYCKRYPAPFARFSGPLTQAVFGARIASRPQFFRDVNCYDNSVLYNDDVVSRMIDVLKQHGGVAAAMYFSDHADDVFRHLGHNSALFTFRMAGIPLLFWTSPEYAQRYPGKVRELQAHKDLMFTNDLAYDTLAGLAGIHSDTTDPQFDLTSSRYQENPTKAFTLHGEMPLVSDKNHLWWEPYNVEELKRMGDADRVIPHRVDSIGKLHDIWAAGFRSFEVDAMYDAASGDFVVGHDEPTRGAPFTTFLESVPVARIGKIWFDLKNLDAGNHVAVLAALDALDQRYHLK